MVALARIALRWLAAQVLLLALRAGAHSLGGSTTTARSCCANTIIHYYLESSTQEEGTALAIKHI